MDLFEEIKGAMEGETAADETTLDKFSRDTSLFEIKPSIAVFPKTVSDIKKLVNIVSGKKKSDPASNISLTARSAGTDMTGGPLTESIVVDFMRHFNHIREANENYAAAEPGVFYRDFERETMKFGAFMPSYPASREICALGGMVANNSGGEKSLVYGKTENFVVELKAVLSDGNEYILKSLGKDELKAKMAQGDFEGDLYRRIFKILDDNYDLAKSAKPKVSKNSAGYDIWNVWDRKTFDLTKLFVGSQGTLGIITEMKFSLVKAKSHSGMFVIFLKDLKSVSGLVNEILPLKPTSLESFDDYTFRLALKFFWGFLKMFARNPFSLVFGFLPDFWMALTRGLPKLTVLAEFEEDSQEAVDAKLEKLEAALKPMDLSRRMARTAKAGRKYWLIRRESFNLLRQKVKGMRTAPFVDDIIVLPEHLPEFLPELYAILDRYELLYTVAGHVGDGNFHVIPLMKLSEESERAKIPKAMEEVNNLVFRYHGSMTGEHNDGLIRSPYIEKMYGSDVYGLFREIKSAFDPLGIFNPGKKVNADINYAFQHIRRD